MSVVLRTPRVYPAANGGTLKNMHACNCCPYGYHIDLDFIRHCEQLAKIKPSDGQLLRRSRRRSRMSLEFMLGVDDAESFDRVQTVPEELEPASPRAAVSTAQQQIQLVPRNVHFSYFPIESRSESSSRSPSIASNLQPNSFPETSAFVSDALDEVVNDFERTLQRTKVNNKQKRNCYSWEDYIDSIDLLWDDQPPSPHSNVKKKEKEPEVPEIPTDGSPSPTDAHALYNIRQQMAISLKRMKDLEEQVKSIPELQTQIANLQDEKTKLQKLLWQKDDELKTTTAEKAQSHANLRHKSTSPISFTPQKISPVSLDSLGSKLRSVESHKVQVVKRDVGTSPLTISARTVGVNTMPDTFYSKDELDNIVRFALEEYEEQREALRRMNLVSMGTQMTPAAKTEVKAVGSQTSASNVATRTIGTSEHSVSDRICDTCSAAKTSVACGTEGRVRSIGTSDHTIADRICDTCSTEKSSVACGTEVGSRTIGTSDHTVSDYNCQTCFASKSTVDSGPNGSRESHKFLSLKLLDMPAPQKPVQLVEKELKTTGTQYEKVAMTDNAVQVNAKSSSIGVQYAYLPAVKSSAMQTSVECHSVGQQYDTKLPIVPETPKIEHKTKGTQYQKAAVNNIGVQHSVKSSSVGVQYNCVELPRELPKIEQRTTGTQSDKRSVKSIGIQNSVKSSSIAIQHISSSQHQMSQCTIDKSSQQTTTHDLIELRSTHSNTDPEIRPAPKAMRHTSSNTENVRTSDHSVNTLPPPIAKHSACNTEQIHTRDIGCGEIVKPHISIACADNYCDSCKDAIKNLAKDFTGSGKGGSVPASPTAVDSKIPRLTNLPSPRPVHKKFVRQNTYTIAAAPSASSVTEELSSDRAENTQIPADKCKNNFDKKFEHSENDVHHNHSSVDTSRTLLWVKEVAAESQRPETVFEESPKREITTIDECQEPRNEPLVEQSEAQSQEVQNMILNQIATANSLPREKASPSKEMKAALKVINDSLQKPTSKSNNLKSANAVVQTEWFQISSTDKANPLDVEDYLDCFEEYSNAVLKYIVNLTDSNGNTAMHYAVSHGNFDVVSILLDSKVCNVNQMNNAGYTCVMLVSLAKLKNSAHRTVVQRLFQMADVNLRAKKHCQTALMLAVSHGNLDMVEMLLAAGADINIQDEDGSTALMCAAEHGRIDIVKHLLSQPDCDSLIQDVDNSTAFKIAWQAGHRDIGLLLYVHEQMIRSKMPSAAKDHHHTSPLSPKHKRQPSPQ